MADIDVSMNVRSTSVVPHEGWTFHTPDVPGLIAADVFLLVERHVQLIDSTGLFQHLHDFVDIFFAIRSQQNSQSLLDECFLLSLQIAHFDSSELAAFTLKLHSSLGRCFLQKCFRGLL